MGTDKQNVEMLILLNVTKDVNQKENHNQKRLENVNVEHLQFKNVDQHQQTKIQDVEYNTLLNVTKDVVQKENHNQKEENQKFQKENQEFQKENHNQEENHNQRKLENVNVEH